MPSDYPLLVFQGVGAAVAVVEVSFAGLPTGDAAGRALLNQVLRTFVEAGARGGYPTADAAPGQSSLRVASDLAPRQGVLTARLEGVQVTSAAFQLLRNMVSRMQGEQPVIKRLLVRDPKSASAAKQRVPEPEDANEERAYPPVSTRLGFAFRSEAFPDSRMRRCLVELAEPPEAEHVEAIARCVKPWFDLLEASAFALPVELPPFGDCIAGDVTLFDEGTVEVVANRFVASECAWYVLLNLLAAQHRKAFSVGAVVFY
jgi:hypothetical protein